METNTSIKTGHADGPLWRYGISRFLAHCCAIWFLMAVYTIYSATPFRQFGHSGGSSTGSSYSFASVSDALGLFHSSYTSEGSADYTKHEAILQYKKMVDKACGRSGLLMFLCFFAYRWARPASRPKTYWDDAKDILRIAVGYVVVAALCFFLYKAYFEHI